MKLTEKDKQFLETLRHLVAERDLWIELRLDRPSYMVLRGTYGEQVHQAFRMSRQGVRWRFQRIFNDIYVSAFETILFIEKAFGTELRDDAVRISQERHAIRQQAMTTDFEPATRPAPGSSDQKKLPGGDRT
ncbi:MAG: hypothetical protein WD534_15200 [Phycisphaeraceae bacterium]